VSEGGVIKTVRKGESATLVRYEGKLSVVNVTAVSDQPFTWQPVPEFNFIDGHVNAKLKRVKTQRPSYRPTPIFCGEFLTT
jgi:hypothetical protein